ncbi:hypothetical protein [Lachnoanaerobaculum gingivalis]|uniref:hypothetical protein n=1 Tax=Lachnoanaerobaculum gingivalis TaxID=2490855 RepID=UPI0028D2E3AD|nr:hypothetical protein [Lachnoanaerobaculum gingivalis]
MDELELIIKKIEDNIDSDDFEVIMIECMKNIESNHNEPGSIEALLKLMERHPLTSFGSPGAIAHFVETFYKKGYEEKLITSLKRMPTVHTVWMLHRIINGADNKEYYLSLLKHISENKDYYEKIRDEALYFLSIH